MIIDIYNPGEKIENEFLKEKIVSKINEMLNWRKKGFPGSNPVSLTNHNIKNLFNKEYMICEKTDGVRYFLFIASNTTFFIDRNYEIYKNDVHIPTGEDLKKKQQLTLLDGELVEDVIFNPKDGEEKKKIVYLIYDGLYIQRRDITQLSYLERLINVYNQVITPLKLYKKYILDKKKNTSKHYTEIECNNAILKKRKYVDGIEEYNENNEINIKQNKDIINNSLLHINNKNYDYDKNQFHNTMNNKKIYSYNAQKDNIGDKNQKEMNDDISSSDESSIDESNDVPFEIYLKDFYHIDDIGELLNIMKKLPHFTDGIIFTPQYLPYIPGNCYQLLKWKPLNLNTVDFGIETIYDENNLPNKFELFISVKGVRTSYKCYLAQYGEVYKQLLELALNEKISHYIIECFYVAKNIYSICKNDNATEKIIEGGWIAQKIRFDKNIPNDISTLNKVIQSIFDNITIDSLVEEIYRNRKTIRNK